MVEVTKSVRKHALIYEQMIQTILSGGFARLRTCDAYSIELREKESHNPPELAIEEKRSDQRRLGEATVPVPFAACLGSP